MDAYAEACHVGDEHQPAVAVRLVGVVFPFKYEPEHYCRECRRVGVDLALDSAEPEGVAERINQCAHKAASLDGYQFAGSKVLPVLEYQLPREMCDCPEQEHYTRGAKQRAHGVDHECHLRRVACKVGEQVGGKHEERCSGRMAYFEFITGSDKFGAVPKACRRLDCATINEGCYQKSQPAQDIVH